MTHAWKVPWVMKCPRHFHDPCVKSPMGHEMKGDLKIDQNEGWRKMLSLCRYVLSCDLSNYVAIIAWVEKTYLWNHDLGYFKKRPRKTLGPFPRPNTCPARGQKNEKFFHRENLYFLFISFLPPTDLKHNLNIPSLCSSIMKNFFLIFSVFFQFFQDFFKFFNFFSSITRYISWIIGFFKKLTYSLRSIIEEETNRTLQLWVFWYWSRKLIKSHVTLKM